MSMKKADQPCEERVQLSPQHTETKKNTDWPYEDIVDLPHHVSKTHPQMAMIKRAAQFAPFAALTGYGDAVTETARLTDDRIEMSETALEELNRRITEAVAGQRTVSVTYFVPDQKKAGGSYRTVTGRIRKMEMGEIVLDDGMRIPATLVAAVEEEDGNG